MGDLALAKSPTGIPGLDEVTEGGLPRSVGIDLRPHIDAGVLCVRSTRPAAHGLEGHLASIIHDLDEFDPRIVAIDPLSAFGSALADREAMLTRLIDLLKSRGITAMCTSMTTAEASELGISTSSTCGSTCAASSTTASATAASRSSRPAEPRTPTRCASS